MASFSPQQKAFIGTYAKATGLNPGVVAAQVAAEEPVGASSGWHGTQNWLNIGITDSGPMGSGNPAWRDPVSAAQLSAAWVKGQTSIPGFGRASSGIQAITRTAGQSPSAQIAALQHSGWASSGYPSLASIYNAYRGVNPPAAAGAAAAPAASAAPQTTTKTVTAFDQAAFDQAQRAAIAGQFLASQGRNMWQTGPKVDMPSGASLFGPGLLTTKMPDRADFTSTHQVAQTVLQKLAGGTSLNAHPDAAGGNYPVGVGSFGGKPVADWIVPILQYAKAHGWQGSVNSGYRSFAEQKAIYDSGVRPAAVPGTSRHEGDAFPRGAVDVSDAQQLSQILSRSPYANVLIWAGSKDPVHFSHPVGGHY